MQRRLLRGQWGWVRGDGKDPGLFLYSTEDPGPCYWVDSPKTLLHGMETTLSLLLIRVWHNDYQFMMCQQNYGIHEKLSSS